MVLLSKYTKKDPSVYSSTWHLFHFLLLRTGRKQLVTKIVISVKRLLSVYLTPETYRKKLFMINACLILQRLAIFWRACCHFKFLRSISLEITGFWNLIGSLLTSDFMKNCGYNFVGKCNFKMLISTMQQTNEFFCH